MKSTLNISAAELALILTTHAQAAFRGSEVKVESVSADETADDAGTVTFNGVSVSVDVTPKEKERKERKKLTAEEQQAKLQAKLDKLKAEQGATAKAGKGKPA